MLPGWCIGRPFFRRASFPHLCACHRDPASPSPWAEMTLFAARTRVGWIPVTSTGMRGKGWNRRKEPLFHLPPRGTNGLLPPGETSFLCFSRRDDITYFKSEGRHRVIFDIHLTLKRDIAPDVANVECTPGSVK